MIRILNIGISYKTAPVEIREKLSFSTLNIIDALKKLHNKQSIKECCIISTCNRVEVYAVTEDPEKCESQILTFLSEFHSQYQTDFKDYFYKNYDGEAVKHLFRVASSMDSMVIGEPQILGQIKEFYKTAYSQKTLGLILHRLFNMTFFAAKRIRSQTNIASQAISISYLAVELAKRIFEDLKKRKVMLIGTGEMSQLAAKHLISNGISELYISSRNFDNAKELSDELNGIPIKYEETLYNLKNVDILITATGSSEYIIKSEHIKECLKLRKNDPIFLIDIAVPRDIDPKINDISGVYLYDIDDLKGVLNENMESRKESLVSAEEIVSYVHENFMNWMNSLKVFPTIVDLKSKFEKIKEQELIKAFNKFDNVSDKEREIIENMAKAIIGKIFHNPTVNLKKEASSYEGMLYAEVVNKLFELKEENKIINLDDAKDWN